MHAGLWIIKGLFNNFHFWEDCGTLIFGHLGLSLATSFLEGFCSVFVHAIERKMILIFSTTCKETQLTFFLILSFLFIAHDSPFSYSLFCFISQEQTAGATFKPKPFSFNPFSFLFPLRSIQKPISPDILSFFS